MKKSLIHRSLVLFVFSIVVLAFSGSVMGMTGYPLPPELKPMTFDDSTVSKSLPVTWKSWKEGQMYTKSIGSGFLLDKIGFEVAQNSEGIVVVSIDKLESVPESIGHEPAGQIYGTGQVSYNKYAFATKAMLYFRVEEEWLASTESNADDIMLMGYDSETDAWRPFEVEATSEGGGSYSVAIPPEIQVFSIVASDSNAAEETSMQDKEGMEQEVVEEPVEEAMMEKTPEAPVVEADFILEPSSTGSNGNNTTLIILILVLIAASGAGLFYYQKKKKS